MSFLSYKFISVSSWLNLMHGNDLALVVNLSYVKDQMLAPQDWYALPRGKKYGNVTRS